MKNFHIVLIYTIDKMHKSFVKKKAILICWHAFYTELTHVYAAENETKLNHLTSSEKGTIVYAFYIYMRNTIKINHVYIVFSHGFPYERVYSQSSLTINIYYCGWNYAREVHYYAKFAMHLSTEYIIQSRNMCNMDKICRSKIETNLHPNALLIILLVQKEFTAHLLLLLFGKKNAFIVHKNAFIVDKNTSTLFFYIIKSNGILN